jgi:hypothetical protein
METVSPARLYWLIRSDAVMGYRSLLTVSATVLALMGLSSVLTDPPPAPDDRFYVLWFGATLFIWGTIASSRAFRELHDKQRNDAYLLLPASALEKTLARLLELTVGLIVYLLIFTSLAALAIEGAKLLLMDVRRELFNPFDRDVWNLSAQYVGLQSFYFLGAAWFRKRHFVKTTLALAVAAIAFFVLGAVIVRWAFGGYWHENVGGAAAAIDQWLPGFVDSVFVSALVLYFVVIPAGCWCIAWLRVRETQVSDGV